LNKTSEIIWFGKTALKKSIEPLFRHIIEHKNLKINKTIKSLTMADLHISKKSISKLFSGMHNRKFIIPDYQSPYKWNLEKCETLWCDLGNFTVTDAKTSADYFLGTIVYVSGKKIFWVNQAQLN
jgi:uncharacterized protein with ParB-like and HNH nuclease domain